MFEKKTNEKTTTAKTTTTVQATAMTTGPVLKVLAPSDSHSAIVAKSIALGVPVPKQFRAFCELDNEMNGLIINNGAIPPGRKHGILSLDILEKLNSM